MTFKIVIIFLIINSDSILTVSDSDNQGSTVNSKHAYVHTFDHIILYARDSAVYNFLSNTIKQYLNDIRALRVRVVMEDHVIVYI